MSKNISINGANYNNVSTIKVLKQGGTEYVDFVDPSEIEVGGNESVLTTKTITANGTYYATNDNADGYSSVIVQVENGGGNSSGGSGSFGECLQAVAPYFNSLASAFVLLRGDTGITTIPDLQLTRCTNIDKIFQNATEVVEVGILDIPECTNVGAFIAGSGITKIGLRNTSKVGSWYQSFRMNNLTEINGELDFTSASNVSGTFQNAASLTRVRFVANTIGLALDMSSCKSLDHDSVISTLNGLKDTGSQLVLKLPASIVSTLSESERAIATNKNWTVEGV